MFIARKINPSTNKVELWKCEWENKEGQPAKKIYIEKHSDENSVIASENEAIRESPAICWSYGRTIGNIAVYTQNILGSFTHKSGNDALLPCDIVEAGKFRHGAPRWYCRTHQCHWGTQADQMVFAETQIMKCASHSQLMCYEVDPYKLDTTKHAEVGIWCSMPPALSSLPIVRRAPKVHVHIRAGIDEKKKLDRDFDAISVLYNSNDNLFGNSEITYVNITPPAAFEFVDALERGIKTDCVNCKKCGYPHLDLGDFSRKPHKKHFCGNCGNDSVWSNDVIISTPLKPLHDRFAKTWKFVEPSREINIDEYEGCTYTIWASTPAIIWSADRPQEKGIHVHIEKNRERIVDDTFGTVYLGGQQLHREELFRKMQQSTIM